MEFSDRIWAKSRSRLRQKTKLPPSEISIVWSGVPELAGGAWPCPCREPGCQGVHDTGAGSGQTPVSSRCRPGSSLWSWTQPEATDIWDLDTRWGGRGWKQDRRPWWPPDRRRGRHDAHLASTASQAPTTTSLWQVAWDDPVQIHYALVYGGPRTSHWASTTLRKPKEVTSPT